MWGQSYKASSNSEVSGNLTASPEGFKEDDRQKVSTFRKLWSSGKIQSIGSSNTAEWLPCSWYLRQVSSTCSVLLQIVSPAPGIPGRAQAVNLCGKSRPSSAAQWISGAHPPWDSLSCCLAPLSSRHPIHLGTDS